MSAIRAARGFTGRDKIIKFEGAITVIGRLAGQGRFRGDDIRRADSPVSQILRKKYDYAPI